MSDEQDKKDPSLTSDEYDAMAPAWRMANAVLGGTRSMRAAGKEFLPQHSAETNDNYKERRQNAVLFNMAKLTLASWVGRPFSDPVLLKDDVPSQVKVLSEDINLQGDALAVFLRKWFEQGLAKSYCHVLIDHPVKYEIEGRERTLDDDRREGIRPYWVLVRPEQLICAHSEVVDGVEKLVHARIMETETLMEGFVRVTRERIRVLTPGHVQLYVRADEKEPNSDWVIQHEWDTDMEDKIPLVTFYADREGFMLGEPPMEDLFHLNVRWWQSNSDQTNVLTVSRFPILAHSGGIDDEKQLEIGPNKWLTTPNPQGKFYYVEHDGNAIEAGRKDLLDLEAEMSNYGAEFLRKRPTNATATARAMDSAESTSPLQDVTLRFVDAVQQALKLTAEWLGLETGGSVQIATDFGPENVSADDLRTLNEGRARGDLSRLQWLRELQRRGVLADDFDSDKNESELEDEAGSLTASPLQAPGAPPVKEEDEIDPNAEK